AAMVKNAKPLLSYAGAAWNKAEKITSAEDWEDHVEDYTEAIKNPLKVKLRSFNNLSTPNFLHLKMSILHSFDLKGKVALVTGCKRGIGKALAEALAEAGADIIGVSASLELQNSKVEQSIKALGRNFYAYQCDFSKREEL